MSQLSPSKGRVLVPALSAVLAATAVAAPVAGATVTSTNITSNTIKAWDMADLTDGWDLPINDRAVSGTVDSGAAVGDSVNIVCFNPISGSEVRTLGTAKVTAARKWSATVGIGEDLERFQPRDYCRIVAVPDGVSIVSASDLRSKYRGGRVVSIGRWKRYAVGLGGPPGNAFTWYFDLWMQSKSNGGWYMGPAGGCGLCGSSVRKPDDGQAGGYFWPFWSNQAQLYEGVAWFPTPPSSGSDADPLMLIDGKLAMSPTQIKDSTPASRSVYAYGPSGGISMSYSIDQSNGDVTVRESSPMYRCVEVVDPSRWQECARVTDTGVRMKRVVTVTADQMIWRAADTFASADGKAHSVRATYSNEQAGFKSGFRFGTSGMYGLPVPADVSGAALGPAPKNAYSVIGVKHDRSNVTLAFDNPVGDIVMAPRPTLVRVLNDSNFRAFPNPRWNLKVPARGSSVTVKQAYTIAASDSELARLRKLAIAGLGR